MGRPAKITRARFTEACRAHHGNMKSIAEALGIANTISIYNFLQKHLDLRDLLEESREELIDIAEDVVIRAIMAGDVPTARWFLERKGKDRGYSVRAEVTGADGAPLTFALETMTVDPVEYVAPVAIEKHNEADD